MPWQYFKHFIIYSNCDCTLAKFALQVIDLFLMYLTITRNLTSYNKVKKMQMISCSIDKLACKNTNVTFQEKILPANIKQCFVEFNDALLC